MTAKGEVGHGVTKAGDALASVDSFGYRCGDSVEGR